MSVASPIASVGVGVAVGALCMAGSAVACIFTFGLGCGAMPAGITAGTMTAGLTATVMPAVSEMCRFCELTHNPEKVHFYALLFRGQHRTNFSQHFLQNF